MVHESFCLGVVAQHKALRRHLGEGEEGKGVVVRCEDVRSALREVRPSAMREVTLEVPKVREMSVSDRHFRMCSIMHVSRYCGEI